jgi:hypothetical protein
MKKLLLLIFLASTFNAFGQEEERTIRGLLALQAKAWNRGDIEGFMQTYWKSDSLMFIGKSGVQRGWQKTLDNYRKSYPDTVSMGKLSFDILEVKKLSDEYYFLVGKWMLSRSIGDLNGHFNLLLRKINGQWVIVADHSS